MQNKEQSLKIITRLKQDHLANVIIFWSLNRRVKEFLAISSQENLHNKIWIFTESMGHEDWFLKFDQLVVMKSIFVTTFSGNNTDFLNYFWSLKLADAELYPWVKTMFQRWNVTDRSITLSDFKGVFDWAVVGYVRNAVLSLLYALKSYIKDNQICINSTNCVLPVVFNHTLFRENYIKNVKFKGVHDHPVQYDRNGDITSGVFHLHTINNTAHGNSSFVQIGEWNTNNGLIIRNDYTDINGRIKSQCAEICDIGYYSVLHLSKPCCWICVPCPSGSYKSHRGLGKCQRCPSNAISDVGRTKCLLMARLYIHSDDTIAITMYVSTVIGVMMCVFIAFTLIRHRTTPIVRSCNLRLSMVQIMAQMMLYLSTILYVPKDTVPICTARIFISGICLPMIVSVTVIKTRSILKVFINTVRLDVHDIKRIKTSGYVGMILLSIFPSLLHVLLLQAKPIDMIIKINVAKEVIEEYCGNTYTHYIVQVIYVILLQVVCAVQAFKARNLPESYHEAGYISFGMFSSTLVLILIIPIIDSMTDINSKYAAFSLMVMLANTLLLLILYGYKIKFIWMQPNLNSAKQFPRPVIKTDIRYKQASDASITSKYIAGEIALIDSAKNQEDIILFE